MLDYFEKFELYLDKLKKIDVSRVFSQNISFPEFVYLKIIDFHSRKNNDKSVQVSELVEDSGVTAQAVSKGLRILESKNYITRFANKFDRRITQVKLTDYGKEVFDITQDEMRKVMNEVFSKFTKDEFDNFIFLTGKFMLLYEEAIDKMKIGG